MNEPDPTELPVLVFATHNANKAREVQDMLSGTYRIQTLSDIGCHEEIPETAADLKGNAFLKAQHVHQEYGLDCFADDTGLEVDALAGAPGVRTARYAGEDADAQANMSKLLGALSGCGWGGSHRALSHRDLPHSRGTGGIHRRYL